MARPTKHEWNKIKLDYECGLSKAEIHKKYDIPYSTLSEYIKNNKWTVSEQTKTIIKGISEVSVVISELKNENPELAKNAIELAVDEISKHIPQYRKMISVIFSNMLDKTSELVGQAKTPKDLLDLAKAIQTQTDTIGISQRHANQQINTQINTQVEQKKIVFVRS